MSYMIVVCFFSLLIFGGANIVLMIRLFSKLKAKEEGLNIFDANSQIKVVKLIFSKYSTDAWNISLLHIVLLRSTFIGAILSQLILIYLLLQ